MRSSIKRAISRVVRSDFAWRILDATVLPAARYADRERDLSERPSLDVEKALSLIAPDLKVRHGAFKGLQYAEKKSFDSTLVPKLLGSYERELETLIERICSTEYREILNIGCAEGYYTGDANPGRPRVRVRRQ